MFFYKKGRSSFAATPFSTNLLFLFIAFIKYIAAFRAEFRRIMRICRLPAAFIASINRSSCRAGFPAFHTEFPLIDCTAAANPTFFRLRARLTAVFTELPAVCCTAFTDPSTCCRSLRARCCRSLPILHLLPHLEQLLRIHAT